MPKNKKDKGTIIRTVVLAFAMLNQGLVMAGWDTLPFTEEEVQNFVTYAFTVIAALVAWWKNNYLSKKGDAQAQHLRKVGLK
ncbi:phage holin [Halobacillus sp. H74]|uniref:phage holin n=1 Tax=Halobacillus sp. H74 TaxID=3457436 RepID=UPI003FCE9705